jgi:hypothetical protein
MQADLSSSEAKQKSAHIFFSLSRKESQSLLYLEAWTPNASWSVLNGPLPNLLAMIPTESPLRMLPIVQRLPSCHMKPPPFDEPNRSHSHDLFGQKRAKKLFRPERAANS